MRVLNNYVEWETVAELIFTPSLHRLSRLVFVTCEITHTFQLSEIRLQTHIPTKWSNMVAQKNDFYPACWDIRVMNTLSVSYRFHCDEKRINLQPRHSVKIFVIPNLLERKKYRITSSGGKKWLPTNSSKSGKSVEELLDCWAMLSG